ncbi:uncharacterized protein METZ01_LOCUS182026, partial [marine metagenome]
MLPGHRWSAQRVGAWRGRPWDRMGVGYFQGCRTLTAAQPVGKLCPS